MTAIDEGALLWEPPGQLASGSVMRAYMRWLEEHHSLRFDDYAGLWEWSVARKSWSLNLTKWFLRKKSVSA